MDNSEEFEDDSILYELLEYFVKKQEPELIRFKNDTLILPTTGTIKNALRYLNNRYSLPESISQQISLTLPWKFAIDETGRYLALLQENLIEIRKSKDEFSSVIGKASVPKDAFPQWRKLSWSPDGSLLVLASSNGCLSFYNSLGNNIFTIVPKTVSQSPEILEAGDAISSLMFKAPRSGTDKWTYEFLVVTYSGLLKSYSISGSHGFEKNYEFSFGNFYRKGVNAFAYDEKHNLYIVAGNSISQSLVSPAASNGLTSWRPLNDYPYYKLSFSFEENSTPPTFSLWNFVPTFRTQSESVICRASISPSCNHLVCLHTDGAISLWDLPSLKLRRKWPLDDQPGHDAQNPLAVKKVKKLSAPLSEFHPVDIGWWSEHAIIIARYSGAVSVCSMGELRNLLGASPEFLYGQPQISEFYSGKGFLSLDCETFVTSKKRKRTPSNDGSASDASDSDLDEDELEPITLLSYSVMLVKSLLYSMTDIERFQPKRKKSKILQRTYRILGLKSTTPEELYARKIDIEEYEDALNLANAYNLDTDLVYQTQWRKSEFSLRAIKDHLSKVSKRSWVLNECIMRVPETLEAARELLNFGLRGANLETFLAIGEADDGKFVVEEDEELAELNSAGADMKHMQKINEILGKVDLKNLSTSQSELINYRRKLLDHLDKLQTYEIIIEDKTKYKKDFYEDFRKHSVIENAIKFAKDCNHRAVEIMFTYHGSKLMPHWLGIISCFPETLNPAEYKKLLPECDDEGQLYLLYQRELRQRDWSEKVEFDEVVERDPADGSGVIYDADPSLSAYRSTQLTMDLLRKWYKSRAYQIERDSCVVENALELIKIGKSHGITGLEDLLVELETLDDVVYKIYREEMTLGELEKLTDLDKIELLMSTASEESFIAHLKGYVLPFLYRRQKYLNVKLEKQLLRNYLVSLSEEDLTLPSKFFHHVMTDVELLEVVDDLMTTALDCIYSCTNPDVYGRAREIFDAVPKPQANRHENPMEQLEKELECLKILNKYGVSSTVRFINENKGDPEHVKLLLNEMARSLKEASPSQDAWTELLNDMLEVQGFIFACVDIEVCFEICVAARLSSGVKSNIQNCKSLIETKKSEKSLLKVSYDKTVELVLEASREYFNSSKSLADPSMDLARTCLNLIEDDNKLIHREFDLINALQILDEFNMNVLPLQVRNAPDKLKLVETCLMTSENAYKWQQRLIMLASYLHIEDHNQRAREGKILELVAIKALDVGDFAVCAATCRQLIDSGYHPAWRVTQRLALSDDFEDVEFKRRCFWFVITYGSSEVLEESLQQVHLLEIQLLNKNLENWMATHELDDGNEENSEDDFTDAMTTPQVEVKEFVPKILETSSGLVKSSAQIFKGSLGLLKNVNQSFWKTALNVNANNLWEDTYELEENVTQEKFRGEIQSFPFFYKSLHEKCLISRIDTQYSKYSTPDVDNTKLKICQTLLRIALLSETASYGFNTSDISHFFVQSCCHVLPDEWLLGLSYLLSFKEDVSSDVDEVFRSLPATDLYLQTAVYFYALQLYRELCPNDSRSLLHDPMQLMEAMVAEARKEDSDVKKSVIHWYNRLIKKEDEVDHQAEKVKEEARPKVKDEVHEEVKQKTQTEVTAEAPRNNQVNDVKKNLYESESFKMAEEAEAWGEDTGWDDDPLVLEEEADTVGRLITEGPAQPTKSKESYSPKEFDMDTGWNDEIFIPIIEVAETIPEVAEDGKPTVQNVDTEEPVKEWVEGEAGWDSWDDFPECEEDAGKLKMPEPSSASSSPDIPADDSTELERFQVLEDLLASMETKEDYVKVKDLLRRSPPFVQPEFTSADRHPVLRVIETVGTFVTKRSHSKHEAAILEEYRDLLEGQSIPPAVFAEFVKKFDEKCSPEDKIFLRLSSDAPDLHAEAIDLMKAADHADFSLPILEAIFFKDLTSSFPPHHQVYDKILEQMFLNHDLSEVEPHVRMLIKKLMEQKHIPYAVALWNQLAAVPSALSTFESCFQLLMKE